MIFSVPCRNGVYGTTGAYRCSIYSQQTALPDLVDNFKKNHIIVFFRRRRNGSDFLEMASCWGFAWIPIVEHKPLEGSYTG